MTSTRILVTVAAAFSAIAFGIVIWRVTCPTCGGGSRAIGEYLPVPHMSDEENSAAKRIWDDIYLPAVEKGEIQDQLLQ